MGGCIGINRTTDTETVNGSSTNVSRPASGKIYLEFIESRQRCLSFNTPTNNDMRHKCIQE